MRSGQPPEMAARTAIERIVSKYPSFSGAVIALNKEGICLRPFLTEKNMKNTFMNQ